MPFHGYDEGMAATDHLVPDLAARRDKLLDVMRSMRRVVVAFSAGVDSTVVACAARLALADDALAVTADSPSVPRAEIELARDLARRIGIAHRVVRTSEFSDPDYVRNDGARCYFCKDELYARIESLLPDLGDAVVCSGANLDDQGDYRPGLKAAAEHRVRHPLQEAGLTKADVRALARSWNLPNWDKPAAPCLSSRLAPGVQATPERTGRVEQAEKLLHRLGLRECRVRLHEGELARIEVPGDAIARLAEAEVREDLVATLQALGFHYVTLDLQGFRSGNLNGMIPLETRKLYAGTDPPGG